MHRPTRRSLLLSTLGVALTPSMAWADAEAGWRRYEITTRVSLADEAGPARLWLPVAQSVGYQTSLTSRCQGSGCSRMVQDAHYGAALLLTEWTADDTAPRAVELVQTVATRDRLPSDPKVAATVAERQFWTQPTASLPTDGIVRATAMQVIAGRSGPREQLRALYDWVVERTARDPETRGCGTGDIASMLRTGNLGGKCADINSLMTGLARAAGFPARDVYGIRVAPSERFASLGAAGTVSKAQHCRSEVYLDEAGWVPLDPADVRKVILEQRVTLDSPLARAARERLFGGWEMNWVGYNSATDIVLPDAAAGQVPNFPFLMYPCAFIGLSQPDCLDPATFHYEITARSVSA